MTSYPPATEPATADDPAAVELRDICRQMDALDDRIADFLAEHAADGHTCPTCDHLDEQGGYPDPWDHLAAARHALWASGAFLDNERPWTAADYAADREQFPHLYPRPGTPMNRSPDEPAPDESAPDQIVRA